MSHSRPWLQPQLPFNTVSNLLHPDLRAQKKGRILLLASCYLLELIFDSLFSHCKQFPQPLKGLIDPSDELPITCRTLAMSCSVSRANSICGNSSGAHHTSMMWYLKR